MHELRFAPRLRAAERMADAGVVVTAAVLAAAAISCWYTRPLLLAASIAALLAALLSRHHSVRDLCGLAVGATLGNAVELSCDLAGVWRHADTPILGVAPVYIFLCYPILGLAVPRLVEALVGERRRRHETSVPDAAVAGTILIANVALTWVFASDPVPQSAIGIVFLAATLARFHSRHDRVAGAAGAVLALVWELPCTMAGAWRFPTPQVFGLLPVWLPLAYAVYFITLGRLTAALTTRVEAVLRRTGARPWPAARRRDLAVVSSLILAAVAGVCLFYRWPVVCALVSAGVLAGALRRWHTSADVAVALCGAVFGPVLEVFATGSELWIYPHTTIGRLPAWVFTLWPAFPVCLVRLTYTLWPPHPGTPRPPARLAAVGIAILAVEIPLLARFGVSHPVTVALVTGAMLVAAAWAVRSPQGTLMLVLSGVFGIACESLPIALGAWHYPHATVLGMPMWLPGGYALFGFGIVQLAHGLDGLRRRTLELPLYDRAAV